MHAQITNCQLQILNIKSPNQVDKIIPQIAFDTKCLLIKYAIK